MTEQEALVEIARQLKRMNDRAEPKHGRWLKKWSALWNEEMPVCSECEKVSVFTSDFCPNCGARMDDVEE